MIFLTCYIPENQRENTRKNTIKNNSYAASNFQELLIKGFCEQGQDLKVINVLPVGCYKRHYKKLWLNNIKNIDDRVKYSFQIGGLNLPFIKQYQRYRTALKIIKKEKEKQDILIYSTLPFYLKVIKKLKIKHNVTVIVTDIPEYFDLSKQKQGLLRRLYTKMIYKYLKSVDNFVLLTEEMKKPLKLTNQPYIVMEGIVNDEKRFPVKCENTIKTIMYSGTLHYQFGIKTLLEAFKKIKDSNYRLVLCGSGDAEKEIENICKEDSRVSFLGYLPYDKVLELQSKVTVLVNPRTNAGEYTKYSFPSKTMEYMASGVPVIMYKLSGIPQEYDKYLNYVEDDTVDSLKNKIVQICSLSDKERKTIGKNAQNFVLKEKNYLVQTKKIIDFINDTK